MKIKAGLSISRRSDDVIVMQVEDSGNGVRFLEIEMSPADFSRAVTSLSVRNLDADVRGTELLGKKRESKTELVPFDCFGVTTRSMGEFHAALAPFEVDGWNGRSTDLLNGHLRGKREDGVLCQRVVFERFVDAEEGS